MVRHSAFTALIVAALVGGVLVGDATAGSRSKTAAVYVPDPRASHSPPLVGDTWIIDDPEYSIRLRKLDPVARREFLARRTGGDTDPFATRPDRPETFLTFALEIENRGSGSLAFHPQNCWLSTSDQQVEYPLDLGTIQTSYRLLEREMPAAYARAATALLEGEQFLAQGETVSGLLVYRYKPSRMRRFTIELQLILADGTVAEFKVPYRRKKR